MTAESSRGFSENRLLRWMAGVYLSVWIVMAIRPVDRIDWLLENLLVFVFAVLLIGSYTAFRFSETSYLLIFFFLCLHAFGAHYTYGQVPAGYWLKDQLNLDRNHFDRVAHFSYGLLFAYPIRELFVRTMRLGGVWPYYFALDMVLAFSAFFELLEAWIAQALDPVTANKYLGSQGDLWDAQNDIAAAFCGALVTCIWIWWRQRAAARMEGSRQRTVRCESG